MCSIFNALSILKHYDGFQYAVPTYARVDFVFFVTYIKMRIAILRWFDFKSLYFTGALSDID